MDPSEVPSPLIGKAAPQFTLPQLKDEQTKFSSQDMRGKVWMLNVWASWCVSCRQEHSTLVAFSRKNIVPLIGLNYEELRGDSGLDELQVEKLPPGEELKYARQRAQKWISDRGNPYQRVVMDLDGNVGIDYGVYGVPETYVIDQQGVIRYKYIGPLTDQALQTDIMPLIRKLEG